MALLDLLGRRWALRILWELRDGPLTFRELRTRCDEMSPSVLNARLGELRATDIVELGETGFALTTDGRELLAALAGLDEWAKKWARRQSRSSGRARTT